MAQIREASGERRWAFERTGADYISLVSVCRSNAGTVTPGRQSPKTSCSTNGRHLRVATERARASNATNRAHGKVVEILRSEPILVRLCPAQGAKTSRAAWCTSASGKT